MFGEPPTQHPHCQDVCWNRKEAYERREGEGGLSERGMEGWKERPQRQTGFLLRTARVAVSFLSV